MEIYLVNYCNSKFSFPGMGYKHNSKLHLDKDGKSRAKIVGKYLQEYQRGNFDGVFTSTMNHGIDMAKIVCQEIHFNFD